MKLLWELGLAGAPWVVGKLLPGLMLISWYIQGLSGESWGSGGKFFKEKNRLQLSCPQAHPQLVLGQSLAELLGGCSPSAAAKSCCVHGNCPNFLTFPWIFYTLGQSWVCPLVVGAARRAQPGLLSVCRSFWAGRAIIGASHLLGKILPFGNLGRFGETGAGRDS